jgi:hypothetical protein
MSVRQDIAELRVGQKVKLQSGDSGVVVFCNGRDEYAPAFPKADWKYLGDGVMIRTDKAALVFLREGWVETSE